MLYWAAYAVLGLLAGSLGLVAIAEGVRHALLSVLLAFAAGAWSAALLCVLMAAFDTDDDGDR